MGGVYRYRASNRAFRQKRKIVSEKLHLTRNIKRPLGALHRYPTISGSKIYQNIMGFTAISGWSARYTASNRAFRKKKIGSDKL